MPTLRFQLIKSAQKGAWAEAQETIGAYLKVEFFQ
jgi:hypothetical protein